jgi:internalin A
MGPAVVWPDGTREYWLNAVKCPKHVVMTSAESLDAKALVTESNAEVRREIIRKIGIERACKLLNAKVIDSEAITAKVPYHTEDGRDSVEGYRDVTLTYELLLLDLGDSRRRPYLRMLNPSTGTYHIEGVAPSVTTVRDALRWRNHTGRLPGVIS